MLERRGLTLLELVVAATLVVSGLVAIGRLSVASGRMWQQTRHQQIALEELGNHLDRLLALPEEEFSAALEELKPSDVAVASLPEVSLSAQVHHETQGQRIDVEICWGHPPRLHSLSLSGWLDAPATGEREPAAEVDDRSIREVPVREEAIPQELPVEPSESEESP